MGNHCKSDNSVNIHGSRNHGEQDCSRAMDDNQQNTRFWDKRVNPTTVNTVAASELTEETNQSSSSVLMQDFISLCSQNRPPGVSNTNWEIFLCSTGVGITKLITESEVNKKPPIKSEGFSMAATHLPSPLSPNSIDAVAGSPAENYRYCPSPTTSVSSVEFAGRFIIPEVDESQVSNSDSTSVWSVYEKSMSCPQRRWSSVRCLNESIDNEYGTESNVFLGSTCTTLHLKDMPSSNEEILFGGENKLCTPAEPGQSIGYKLDLNGTILSDET